MGGNLEPAIGEWRQCLGQGYVCTDETTLNHYARSTQPRGTRPAAVLRPQTRDEVCTVVRIASRHCIPIYPVSRGKNWGYGDACAVTDGQVILDLSRMNRIWEVNEALAYAVIEPGVTQQQLHDYLAAHGHRLWLDVTGAGPDASVIGNTLERGFGHTPYGDHYQCSAGYEVVLADGRTLTTGFGHYGNAEASYIYKAGLGPSLDGLFSQSNLGVVTKMGVWLLPKPERLLGFFFSIPEDDGLPEVIERLRELRLAGVVQSTVHIANDLRVLSARQSYPWALTQGATPLNPAVRLQLRKNAGLGAWNALGAFYGSREMVSAGRRALKRSLAGMVTLKTVNERRLRIAEAILPWLNRLGIGGRIADQLRAVRPVFELLRGTPSSEHLAGAGWRSRNERNSKSFDPLDNGWGIYWLSPVLPMTGTAARALLGIVEPIFQRFAFEPLITMTSITARALCCVLTVAYDRDNPAESAAAQECYERLFDAVMKSGFIPYRVGIQSMAGISTSNADVFWDVVGTLKDALDPAAILAPGRYNPRRFPQSP
jgi:4-cresol dehydrogenase (hydroxylating) flavoprotein subunit